MKDQNQIREENAIVLDFLKHGYPFEKNDFKNPVAQALGINHLTILELIPKKEFDLQPYERVYIGEGKRDKIHHIKGRIPYEKLTGTAKNELNHALREVISEDEGRFVKFFNIAQPLSMRMHQLELLPGLGKKHMWEIIEERKEKPFENFKDLIERLNNKIPDPVNMIVKRVIKELEGEEKYNIFVGR